MLGAIETSAVDAYLAIANCDAAPRDEARVIHCSSTGCRGIYRSRHSSSEQQHNYDCDCERRKVSSKLLSGTAVDAETTRAGLRDRSKSVFFLEMQASISKRSPSTMHRCSGGMDSASSVCLDKPFADTSKRIAIIQATSGMKQYKMLHKLAASAPKLLRAKDRIVDREPVL